MERLPISKRIFACCNRTSVIYVVYEEPAVPEETSEDKNKDDDDDFEIFDL